jgi:hypothetical protein
LGRKSWDEISPAEWAFWGCEDSRPYTRRADAINGVVFVEWAGASMPVHVSWWCGTKCRPISIKAPISPLFFPASIPYHFE